MSTIQASNVSDGTTTLGTSYVVNGSAKAWVNFNGTGTVAIRDSLNHSSITDTGTGGYKENFSSAFSDANHASVGSTQGCAIGGIPIIAVNQCVGQTTTSVSLYGNIGTGATATDLPYIGVNTHGDLA